ncbi:MAG: hypothetical protein FWG72_00615 [Oscillospiraceae bacterium]|nr:hypothetical protein [Oscillospiraceae bacterium]
MTGRLTAVYSAAHFFTDLACAFLMFRFLADAPDPALCFLLYNFFAFAWQMPLGVLADKLSQNRLFAAAGCVLVGAAYAFTAAPAAAAALAGLGNALFHIGGGIDILNAAKGRAGILGVFVAPGALGVYCGTVWAKGNGSPDIVILAALVASAAVIALLCRGTPENAPFSLGGGGFSRGITAAVAAGLFMVVCLRSYIGLSLDFPWKGAGVWGLALLGAAFAGKLGGGFAADRLGYVRVGFAALGLAAVLLLLPSLPAAGVGAVLLLNVTMPVTLWGMAKLFPNAKGFAFGVLTFALFLGFLPVHYA